MTNRARLTVKDAKSVLTALDLHPGDEDDSNVKAVVAALDRMMGNEDASDLEGLAGLSERASSPRGRPGTNRSDVAETLVVSKSVFTDLQLQVSAMAEEIQELRRHQGAIESTLQQSQASVARTPVPAGALLEAVAEENSGDSRAALITEIKELLERRKQLRVHLESLLAELAATVGEAELEQKEALSRPAVPEPELTARVTTRKRVTPQPAPGSDVEEICASR